MNVNYLGMNSFGWIVLRTSLKIAISSYLRLLLTSISINIIADKAEKKLKGGLSV